MIQYKSKRFVESALGIGAGLGQGSQLVFERLFGEFFKHVHAEWLAHRHTFHDASIDYLHQLIKAILLRICGDKQCRNQASQADEQI